MSAGVVIRDRELAVKLLAGSCEDFGNWLFDPKGSGRRSTSGLGQAYLRPCPTCSEAPVKNLKPKPGLKLDRFGRESPCPMCTKPGKSRGTGRVWKDSTLQGDVVVQSAETSAPPTKPAKTRRCEHCKGLGALPNEQRCGWCRGEGRIVVDAFVLADERQGGERDPLDAYLAAVGRRDEAGSYREYLVLEAELRARSPHLLRAFRALYVDVPRGVLRGDEVRYAAAALRFYCSHMPAEIRVPRWVVEAYERALAQPKPKGRGVTKMAREDRDAEIVRRFRAGVSVREIAEGFALSVGRVNEIVYQEREVA